MLDWMDTPVVLHSIYALGGLSLFFVGLYGLLAKGHLLKTFIAIAIMELAVYLLFIALATTPGETAPILADGLVDFSGMADPVPQALTLTALVIGMAVQALGISMAIQYHRLTGNAGVGDFTEVER